MKIHAALLISLSCLPAAGYAGVFNLATFTCDSYENQILNAAPAEQSEDAVNFAMWLFGFAVGRSGDHSIYSNGLQTFGNVLDADCKSRPSASLLDALGSINPANESPMDLKELDCATFESRHTDMMRSDPDSARTIMMWLFGFSVGKSGGRVFDTGAVGDFDKLLAKQCSLHAHASLFDALSAVRMPKKAR
ncbi:MAG: hypothetical protein ACHQIL_01720 [Steroidobacterales bacterium]